MVWTAPLRGSLSRAHIPRGVLQLPNTFPRQAEILADILQRLRLSTVETETLRDDFLLAAVEHFD